MTTGVILLDPHIKIFTKIIEIAKEAEKIKQQWNRTITNNFSGICGFDGFIDTLIRMEDPSSMEKLGPKISSAAGIAASYRVTHKGDKFGGNGPLLTGAISDIFVNNIDLSYIGSVGMNRILPIFKEALENKTSNIFTLAEPAHSECLEFTDGKIMLSDLSRCAEVTWERLIECVGSDKLDELLLKSDFIGAVNWGKLVNSGKIWENTAVRLSELKIPSKQVYFFMDLAEFEQRSREDIKKLLKTVKTITKQCRTFLSFNLKEAWQMGEHLGLNYAGKKNPVDVADLGSKLKERIEVDRVIIHPNDGAVCASGDETIYIPGPVCKTPLISTGAGDNFGAGCLAGALKGLDNTGIILSGVCASGYFVRTGQSPSFKEMGVLFDLWIDGTLPERLS